MNQQPVHYHSIMWKIGIIVTTILGVVGCTSPTTSDETTLSPTIAQWIPLEFSGYTWRVKKKDVPYGPGPNYFSDSQSNVWVDEAGYLHLKITSRDNRWYCAEVVTEQSFGYGTYRFYLSGDVDRLNENVTLGLFTWSDDPAYHYREIDIELARWSDPANDNGQFVVQPWYTNGNMVRFPIRLDDADSVYSFEWRAESIVFLAAYDNAALAEADRTIYTWEYTGPDIPRPGDENARINLWLVNGLPPSDGQEVEVVIRKFEFIP